MPFTATQIRQLARSASRPHTTQLEHIISEANRVFGYDAWNREILSTDCVWRNKFDQGFHAAYTAKIRITVRAGDILVAREGHGAGEAKAPTPGQAHAAALTSAEADAMRRVLATFGRRFGFGRSRNKQSAPKKKTSVAEAEEHAPPSDDAPPSGQERPKPARINKAALPLAEPRRRRDQDHLRFVRQQPCLVCGRAPSQAHHLRFAQPKALGRKVSDEFTVPLCSAHHDQLHHVGDEKSWWKKRGIDPFPIASGLWSESREVRPRVDTHHACSEA